MTYTDFEKKNVFIVGGSEGIGLESAKLFSKMGANVIIFSRNTEKLKDALEEIKNQRTGDTRAFAYMELDVTDEEKVKNVMESACTDFGEVDILINCAGKAVPGYFEEIDYQRFDTVVKVNLYGIRNTIAALLPYMRKKGGSIANVSSMAGFGGIFGYTDYCAAKAGVFMFSEALRAEVKWDNIYVSVLFPPDTDTPGYKAELKTLPYETAVISENGKMRAPQFVADALIKGIKKKKFIIIPGLDNKIFFCLKRFAPWVIDLIMFGSIKKARKQAGKQTGK